jgi:hypothetical protein
VPPGVSEARFVLVLGDGGVDSDPPIPEDEEEGFGGTEREMDVEDRLGASSGSMAGSCWCCCCLEEEEKLVLGVGEVGTRPSSANARALPARWCR